MNPTEPVSSKKNLFEAGEAWNQNIVSMTPSKVNDKQLYAGSVQEVSFWCSLIVNVHWKKHFRVKCSLF